MADETMRLADSLLRKRGSIFDTINGLKAAGHNEDVIAFQLIKMANITSSPTKATSLLEIANEVLKTKYSPADAARLMSEKGFVVLKEMRGLDLVYEYPNGPKIYVVKGMDWSTQPTNMDKFLGDIEEVIRDLKADKIVDSITIFDTPNPHDYVYSERYGRKFESAAQSKSDGRSIEIFKGGLDKEATYHEVAHNLDKQIKRLLGEGNREYSSSDEWKRAIEADKAYYQWQYPSEYARTNSTEDFAESMRYYFKDPFLFEARFPNRTKELLKILRKLQMIRR